MDPKYDDKNALTPIDRLPHELPLPVIKDSNLRTKVPTVYGRLTKLMAGQTLLNHCTAPCMNANIEDLIASILRNKDTIVKPFSQFPFQLHFHLHLSQNACKK